MKYANLIILFFILFSIKVRLMHSPYFYAKTKYLKQENDETITKIFKLKAQAKIFTPFQNMFELFSGQAVSQQTLKQNKQVAELFFKFLSRNKTNFSNLANSIFKESAQKSQASNELNEIYHLQKVNFMKCVQKFSNLLQDYQSIFSSSDKTNEENYNINSQFIIKQFQKYEFISCKEKIQRFSNVSKSSYHGNFQIKNQQIYVKEQKISGDTLSLVPVKLLLTNIKKYILSESDKKDLSKKFNLFLLNYYRAFKKDVGFFPPKLSLKYVMYNTCDKQFQISNQYLILWCLGLINEPLTYLQKINFLDKSNKQEQFYMNQNQIYVNPVFQKVQYQQPINIKKKYFLSKLQNINSLIKLYASKNEKNQSSNQQEGLKATFEQKNISSQGNKQWTDLNQFVAVYNYLMMIYQFNNGHPFQFQKKSQTEKQIKGQRYSQSILKLSFAKYCLQNKKNLWSIFYQSVQNQGHKKAIIFEMAKEVPINFEQINLILAQRPEHIIKLIDSTQRQFQAYLKKRKNRNSLTLKFLAFVVQSSSTLLITAHNPIRYACIYMLYKLNNYISTFQTQQFQKCFKYGEYITRRKALLNNSLIQSQEEKMQSYKQKAYSKLKEYSVCQNLEIKNLMSTKLKSYLQKIEKWQQQKQNQHRQSIDPDQIVQVIELLLKLINELIMVKKLVYMKNLQIKYELKRTQNYLLVEDILSFCCNAMQMNSYLLLIITTILKDFPAQNLLTQNINLEMFQKSDQVNSSLVKKVGKLGTVGKQQLLNRFHRAESWNKIKQIQAQLKKHFIQMIGRKLFQLNIRKKQNKAYENQEESEVKKPKKKNKNDKSYVEKIVDYHQCFRQLQKGIVQKLMISELLSMKSTKLNLIGLQCSQKLIQLINSQLTKGSNSYHYAKTSEGWLQVLKMISEGFERSQKQFQKQQQEILFIIKGCTKNLKFEEQRIKESS